MATLRLDVRPGDVSPPICMVAELRSVDGKGRSRFERRLEVVAGRELAIDGLAPGTWEVRVLTPTGPMVSGEIDLVAGIEGRLTLQVVQVRSRKPVLEPRSNGSVEARATSAPYDAATTTTGGANEYRGVERAFAEAASDSVRITVLASKPELASNPVLVSNALERWRSVARCVGGKVSIRRALALRDVGMTIRHPFGEPAEARFDEVARRGRRIFALVESGHGTRLHSVPAPFRPHASENVVLLHARLDSFGDLRSRVELSEPIYGGIVAYLAAGAVVTAAELARGVTRDLTEDALREKRSSPLGACAAAYVLIGSGKSADEAPWHEWVGNLRRWFPDLPDGAILEARLRLSRARTPHQVREVVDLLREAVARGIPFYAVGIGWLVQSLRHFPDDPLLAETLPWIERVADAVDMDEPFTTLRIGGGR